MLYILSDDSVQCDFCAMVIDYRLKWNGNTQQEPEMDTHNGNISSTIDGCLPLDPALDELAWYCGVQEFTTHEVAEKRPINGDCSISAMYKNGAGIGTTLIIMQNHP